MFRLRAGASRLAVFEPILPPLERPDFSFVLADGGKLLLPPMEVMANHE